MAVFAAFALRLILMLAIGGCLVLLVSLLWLTYKERSMLADQRYGARVDQQSADLPGCARVRLLRTLPHAIRTSDTGLGERDQRRAASPSRGGG
jgi:hypothetical protein